MPDLEERIAEWRRKMLAAGIKTPVPLDELESHLRDDVEQQARLGLGPQQAFETAVQRIGHANRLKVEFKKVGGMNTLRPGKLLGLACGVIAGSFSLMILRTLVTAPEPSFVARMLGLAAVVTTILGWRYSHKFLPVIRSQRTRTAIGIACCLLASAWMALLIQFILPHLVAVPAGEEISVGRVLNVFLWAMTLVAVLSGVAYGLEKVARKQAQTAGS
jgi:cation transport ATPase